MNQGEATETNTLLRWLTGTTPTSWNLPDGYALAAARNLAERAYKVKGAGLTDQQLQAAWPKASPAELAAENKRLKDGMARLIRALRAHDDDTGDYSRCADELEGLLDGGEPS